MRCLSSRADSCRAAESLDTVSWSMFESLRERIYSEVASLISQNEVRPHYLVELFRRLQLLSTVDQRRQVMATFEHLVTDGVSHRDEETARHSDPQHSVSLTVLLACLIVCDSPLRM